MEKPLYTGRDLVLKRDSIPELLDELTMLGIAPKTEVPRRGLDDSLELAKTENRPVVARDPGMTLGWDDFHGEYYLVVPDTYDPGNLVAVLFERLVSGGEEDPEEDLREGRRLIQEYLGVIEEKEKVSLRDVKEKLASLVTDMKKALRLFEEEDYSDEEFDRLSTALDKAYFDPISEILEGVLVTIAGG